MKTTKTALLCLFLMAVMALSLTGCGKKESADINVLVNQNLLIEPSAEHRQVELGKVDNPLDPQAVYDNLEYDYRMLYGQYAIPVTTECTVFHYENLPLMDYKTEYAEQLTIIPFCLQAGVATYNHKINHVDGLHVVHGTFLDEDGNNVYLYFDYRFEGKQLLLYPLDFEYLEDKDMYEYTIDPEPFTYDFRYEGRKLTLSKDGFSLELYADLGAYRDEFYLSAEGELDPDSEPIDGITEISLGYSENGENQWFNLDSESGPWGYNPKAVVYLQSNGLMTMTLSNGEETKTYQYVYFLCGRDGIILTDGVKTHFYCSNWWGEYKSVLGSNLSISDQENISNISADALQAIVTKRADLLTDLTAAFRDAGIAVQVDEDSGEILMDSTILFPTGEYSLSQEGKELLKQFMNVYCSVVFNEKYDGFVSNIVIEGHTDSTGSYEMNKELSINRADAVSDFCLSGDCLSDTAYTQKLETMLQTMGYAYDKLIYNADGTENMAASRRVAFRFLISLEG